MTSDCCEGSARRKFLQASAVAGGLAALGLPSLSSGQRDERSGAQASIMDEWNAGPLQHIIPTANHERFLIKISLKSAVYEAPRLRVDDRQIVGSRTDVIGRCFQFDIPKLQPATRYELQLFDAGGARLSDPWPLKTFPDPDAPVEHLRILAYTCGGGYDGPMFKGHTLWLDMGARRRLLERGLAFNPDVVIANGDQLYWDQKTWANKPAALRDHLEKYWWGRFGTFDWSQPANLGHNDAILQSVCDYQIAGLYGCKLRSTPSFFQTDDHDLFENDEFDKQVATLPPGEFGLFGEDITQLRNYPEFLPTRGRPSFLLGSTAPNRAPDVNQFFGALRYSSLLELVMYDCRRYVDYKGSQARVVPAWTEDWLKARTMAEDTRHFIHSPSLPFGYSSGKLGDWYPDAVGANGKLSLDRQKPGWQPGWLSQHQRIVEMLTSQKRRAAVMIQGDYHASAVATMMRSGNIDCRSNPVEMVLTGTLGSGDFAFPSFAHKVDNSPSLTLTAPQPFPVKEKNGFTIIDVTPDKLTFRLFMWRPPQAVDQIETMEPAITYEVKSRV